MLVKSIALVASLALTAHVAQAQEFPYIQNPPSAAHPLDADIGAPEERHAHDVAPAKRSLISRLFHRRIPKGAWVGMDPLLKAKLENIYAQLRREGYDVRLVEGHRSEKRQAELLATGQGVTQVGPGRSCHNYGLAADSAVFKRGQATWDLNDEWVRRGYERYGELATKAGLRWGGHWTTFKDLPHVELRNDCRVAIRERRRTDGRVVAREVDFGLELDRWLSAPTAWDGERYARLCPTSQESMHACGLVAIWWIPNWAMSPAWRWQGRPLGEDRVCSWHAA